VSITSLHDSDDHPDKVSTDVDSGSKDLGAKGSGDDVGDNDLDRVSILRSNRDGDVVLVMDLVDVRVQLRVMQSTMTPIESKVLNDHAEEHLNDDFRNLREALQIESEEDLIEHNVTKKQSRCSDKVEESQSLESLLKHIPPFLRVGIPRPGVIENSVSLKEWDFQGVNKVHNDVAESEDGEVTTPAEHHIHLGLSVAGFSERRQKGFEQNGNQIEETHSDGYGTHKTVTLSAIAHRIVLEDLLHRVIGRTRAGCGVS